MAGTLGDLYRNHVLDAILGQGFTKPASVDVAFYSEAPNHAGGGIELVGSGYVRKTVTNNATNFPNASSGTKSNGVDFVWSAAAAADWLPIVAVALFEVGSNNLIMFGALSSRIMVLAGENAMIPAGFATFGAS